jgi:hypothetical protein
VLPLGLCFLPALSCWGVAPVVAGVARQGLPVTVKPAGDALEPVANGRAWRATPALTRSTYLSSSVLNDEYSAPARSYRDSTWLR